MQAYGQRVAQDRYLRNNVACKEAKRTIAGSAVSGAGNRDHAYPKGKVSAEGGTYQAGSWLLVQQHSSELLGEHLCWVQRSCLETPNQHPSSLGGDLPLRFHLMQQANLCEENMALLLHPTQQAKFDLSAGTSY